MKPQQGVSLSVAQRHQYQFGPFTDLLLQTFIQEQNGCETAAGSGVFFKFGLFSVS